MSWKKVKGHDHLARAFDEDHRHVRIDLQTHIRPKPRARRELDAEQVRQLLVHDINRQLQLAQFVLHFGSLGFCLWRRQRNIQTSTLQAR